MHLHRNRILLVPKSPISCLLHALAKWPTAAGVKDPAGRQNAWYELADQLAPSLYQVFFVPHSERMFSLARTMKLPFVALTRHSPNA